MTDPTPETSSPSAGDTDTESLYGAPPDGSADPSAVAEDDTDLDPADGGPSTPDQTHQ